MLAEIITEGANLRYGAGMSFGIKDQLADGDIVELLEAWQNPRWLSVRVAKARSKDQVGRTGYIWSNELHPLPEKAPGPPPFWGNDEEDEGGDWRNDTEYPTLSRFLLAVAIVISVAVAICAIVYTVS
jgi:hypothetical protein